MKRYTQSYTCRTWLFLFGAYRHCQCPTGVAVCTDAIGRTLASLLLSEVTNATCMGLNTAWVTWKQHRSHHWEAACLHVDMENSPMTLRNKRLKDCSLYLVFNIDNFLKWQQRDSLTKCCMTSAHKAKVQNWILPFEKNCTLWHSSMLAEHLQRPNSRCKRSEVVCGAF